MFRKEFTTKTNASNDVFILNQRLATVHYVKSVVKGKIRSSIKSTWSAMAWSDVMFQILYFSHPPSRFLLILRSQHAAAAAANVPTFCDGKGCKASQDRSAGRCLPICFIFYARFLKRRVFNACFSRQFWRSKDAIPQCVTCNTGNKVRRRPFFADVLSKRAFLADTRA